jgi:trissin receptor
MERYLAIQHPISSKQILTSSRLKGVIVIVWLGSVLYSSPKFLYVQTIPNRVGSEIGSCKNIIILSKWIYNLIFIVFQTTETICIVNRRDYNIKLFDIINFVLLYVVPLTLMTVISFKKKYKMIHF